MHSLLLGRRTVDVKAEPRLLRGTATTHFYRFTVLIRAELSVRLCAIALRAIPLALGRGFALPPCPLPFCLALLPPCFLPCPLAPCCRIASRSSLYRRGGPLFEVAPPLQRTLRAKAREGKTSRFGKLLE